MPRSAADPTRIAVVTGPRHGGPLRWATDLARWIDRTPAFESRLVHRLGPVLRTPFSLPGDIVHSTLPITVRTWRKPFVLTVKGEYTMENPFWRAMYPIAVRSADTVTVPSHFLAARIPALANATVIPNAVDLERFPAPTVRRDGTTVRAVMVTNFWFDDKVRGVRRAVDAVERVRTAVGIPLEVTVVGGGALLDGVVRAIGRRASFTGWIDPRPFLDRSDIFLYRSEHDNMPNAILEAMASGLPVLTNRVGAVGEMVRHGVDGFIADNDSSFEQHLATLVRDSVLRRELGRSARVRIEQEFSWETVVQRYVEIYSRLR